MLLNPLIYVSSVINFVVQNMHDLISCGICSNDVLVPKTGNLED